jgi:hypothetical protein
LHLRSSGKLSIHLNPFALTSDLPKQRRLIAICALDTAPRWIDVIGPGKRKEG